LGKKKKKNTQGTAIFINGFGLLTTKHKKKHTPTPSWGNSKKDKKEKAFLLNTEKSQEIVVAKAGGKKKKQEEGGNGKKVKERPQG